MPGVVTALVTSDDLEMFGEQINDLALAFVSPLGADCTMTLLIKKDSLWF
jgi:hypothetical protein